MIERAGTAVCLSVAIVVVAAIVLHKPEHPQAVAAEATRVEPPKAPAKPPTVTPGTPWPAPAKVADEPMPKVGAASKRPPEAPLTEVRKGETFADVGRRVYGEAADLDAFWKMNRDQLATRDAEVRPGMILRTPPL